ncbi:hypothetical protein LCGC14_1287600 [marine sediment metagenome]|uniref:Uncharacterized protein n=1 Tax=marine sediment metagenome TaxID=412755 RepID=A0A0F9NA11_9ZZZZ
MLRRHFLQFLTTIPFFAGKKETPEIRKPKCDLFDKVLVTGVRGNKTYIGIVNGVYKHALLPLEKKEIEYRYTVKITEPKDDVRGLGIGEDSIIKVLEKHNA